MQTSWKSWASSLGAALGLHVVALLVCSLLAPPAEPVALGAPVELEIVEAAAVPVVPDPPPAPPEPVAEPPVVTPPVPAEPVPTPRVRRRSPSADPSAGPGQSPGPTPDPGPSPDPNGVAVPAPTPDPNASAARSAPSLDGPSLRSLARSSVGSLAPPTPGVLRRDPTIGARAKAEPRYRLVPTGNGGLRYDDSGYTAQISPDGSVRFRDKPVVTYIDQAGNRVAAPNDAEILRLEQARFMEATREVRQQMAERVREQQRRHAITDLPDKLRALWSDQRRTAAARRRLLFELWDEALEARETPRADQPAGAQARIHILAFIRSKLPKGSPDAYTETELELLNRGRASKGRFEPYAVMQ